jgi:hypothetical protein
VTNYIENHDSNIDSLKMPTVLQSVWINNNTVEILAVTMYTCGNIIFKGSHTFKNDTVILKYSIKEFKNAQFCECPYFLVYQISDLPTKNISIEIRAH